MKSLWRGGFTSSVLGENGAVSSTLGSPPVSTASRAVTPGWRDPRLWIGVAIVAASVLVGARVLASADDTVAVWAMAADRSTGEVLSDDDLVTQRVRFADDEALARYFAVDDTLPADVRLLRALGSGELLPRAAVGSAEMEGTAEISLAVAPLLIPPAVGAGSVVDVYLSERGVAAESTGRQDPAAAEPALSQVSVVEAPAADETFAASGERQLVLAVATDEVGAFYGRLNALGDAVVTIVRRS